MQEHDKPHDELLLMNRKSNWNRTELLTDRFLRGLTQRIGRLFSATRKLARNGLGGDNGDLLEADFWGVRRSHRNKGVSQAGI
jgi:hypothetical protein